MKLITITLFTGVFLSLTAGCGVHHARKLDYVYVKPKGWTDQLHAEEHVAAGFDTSRLVKLTRFILADSIANIHSLLIIKDGELIYENYFPGKDQHWGIGLGYAQHDSITLHDIRSISKSVVAACINIAVQQHLIASIDDPVFRYLPQYAAYRTPQNTNITIKDFLTMSSGMAWNENVAHGTYANDETQMEKSMNPVAYVLSRPMVATPGKVWNYNSGGVQVLEEMIRNVSGKDIDIYARQFLFEPMVIRHYKWSKTNIARLLKPDNVFRLIGKHRDFPAAESGLQLISRDMAKFGLLYLNSNSPSRVTVICSGQT